MTDKERLQALSVLVKQSPFEKSYEVSNSNINFLLRLASDYMDKKSVRV